MPEILVREVQFVLTAVTGFLKAAHQFRQRGGGGWCCFGCGTRQRGDSVIGIDAWQFADDGEAHQGNQFPQPLQGLGVTRQTMQVDGETQPGMATFLHQVECLGCGIETGPAGRPRAA